MATDLVRSVSAYPSKEKLAFRHRIPGGHKGRGRAFTKEIAAAQGFNRHKLAQVVSFE
jgi:hypothetical protein